MSIVLDKPALLLNIAQEILSPQSGDVAVQRLYIQEDIFNKINEYKMSILRYGSITQ
jgi:hypothetical protein